MTTNVIWTAEAIKALGVRTDVPTAGAILGGLCKDEAYRMVKRGDFPVPVLHVGRRLVVPTAPILELLGLDFDMATGGTSPEVPPANAAGPTPEGTTNAKRTSATR